MAWQPPTAEQIRERALGMRADHHDALRKTIARLRVVAAVLAVVGLLVAVGVPIAVIASLPRHASRVIALVPAVIGLTLAGFGVWSWSLYAPLPSELRTSGVPTPAVVLQSGMVGPSIRTQGFGVDGTLMRHRYLLEVRPAGGAPYHVEIKAFGGPMMLAINQPPVTVFVDPANPKRVFPDWSTVPSGA